MAYLEAWKLANGNVQWVIWDLQRQFNDEHYLSAGISDTEVQFGDLTVDGVLSETFAEAGGTEYYAPGIWTDPPNGVHVLYGWARTTNGLYYPAGSFTIILGSPDSIGDSSGWANGVWYIGYNGAWCEAQRFIGYNGAWKG